jgi:hypothetical protein
MTIFTVSSETPPIWTARSPYLYPPEQGGPIIPRALGFLFVASYDPQGYSGVILTLLHTDHIEYCSVNSVFVLKGTIQKQFNVGVVIVKATIQI